MASDTFTNDSDIPAQVSRQANTALERAESAYVVVTACLLVLIVMVVDMVNTSNNERAAAYNELLKEVYLNPREKKIFSEEEPQITADYFAPVSESACIYAGL